jgi:hypothetical protein
MAEFDEHWLRYDLLTALACNVSFLPVPASNIHSFALFALLRTRSMQAPDAPVEAN